MRTSKFALALIFSIFTYFNIYAGDEGAQTANWLYSIDEAVQIAAEEDKIILINFSGSDWCAPCIRLEQNLFSTEAFNEYSDENLILLKLDFPAQKKNKLSEDQLKHNEALAESYNKKGIFPKVVLIRPDGSVKGYMGHPKVSANDYIESIQTIINK